MGAAGARGHLCQARGAGGVSERRRAARQAVPYLLTLSPAQAGARVHGAARGARGVVTLETGRLSVHALKKTR